VLRYCLAYVIPGATMLGLALGGGWVWLGVVQTYVMFPILDSIVPEDRGNPEPAAEPGMSSSAFYRFLTWSAVPVQIAVLVWGGFFVASPETGPVEKIGAVLAVGIASGGYAIVVGHELMHQRRIERWLGRILMGSVAYAHFCIEHVQGHHVHVATPRDPASAARGQSVYRFFVQTIIGSWRSAWAIEAARLQRKGRPVLHPSNRMLQDALATVVLVVGSGALWGWIGAVYFVGQSIVAILELEAINYIEHYGLRRREIAPGRYEPTDSRHSWNDSRRLTNWALFNLGRHTDHHNAAGRRYQILRHVDAAPQLPLGYAAMLLVAFVPPLWRRIMDPRVDAAMGDLR
jgi:alkane 1-monooxygenase